MAATHDRVSTRQFAEKAGVSTSTVSKWLRSGKISGRKKSGRWVISISELAKLDSEKSTQAKSEAIASPVTAPASGKGHVYTIAQFSEMTYLTEYGVLKWLREGKLNGAVDANGEKGVDATSLENPFVSRLVR